MKVWGNNPRKDIYIPLLVHHYNQWMGGVDMIDQHISYYMPDFRCNRNWLPTFIQMLAMIRNNSYLVHVDHYTKKYGKKKCMSHKMFTLCMIEDLMEKANNLTTVELPRFQNTPSLSTPVFKRGEAA
eukprot:4532524-Ditylum_brightwellii.AAC.1